MKKQRRNHSQEFKREAVALERENARLKNLVADLILDRDIVAEARKRNY